MQYGMGYIATCCFDMLLMALDEVFLRFHIYFWKQCLCGHNYLGTKTLLLNIYVDICSTVGYIWRYGCLLRATCPSFLPTCKGKSTESTPAGKLLSQLLYSSIVSYSSKQLLILLITTQHKTADTVWGKLVNIMWHLAVKQLHISL